MARLSGSITRLAGLELTDFTVASAGNLVPNQGHELGVLHDRRASTALSGTEGSALTVGDPVVVCLVVLVVLLEGVIQRTVKPVELRDATEVEGHLGVLVWRVVVTSANWVYLLVDI